MGSKRNVASGNDRVDVQVGQVTGRRDTGKARRTPAGRHHPGRTENIRSGNATVGRQVDEIRATSPSAGNPAGGAASRPRQPGRAAAPDPSTPSDLGETPMFADPTGARVAAFAAVFVALYVAHQVGDHWIQTQHQADCKGQPGWPGRIACAAHVATYTLTALLALVFLIAGTGLRLDPWAVGVGLTVSAVSHYIADRRTRSSASLTRSDRAASTRSASPARSRRQPSLGTGAYALDQSWHVAFLFVSALLIAA
ncbi:DUF3307 domain-containing protein [Micromonospora sp. M12]